jgi:hypothetical protein
MKGKTNREKTTLRLDIAAFVLSCFSVMLSIFALWIATENRHGPRLSDQPFRVTIPMAVSECLVNQAASTQDGDEKPESGESDTDACESDAGVHEK